MPEEVAAQLQAHGVAVRADEARRVLAHYLSPMARRDAKKRPLGKALKAEVARLFDLARLEVLERATDPADGFVKYLFRHADGALSEAVRIPLHRPGHFTVCLSSQVGCAMRCAFCATAGLGLQRNLSAAEIALAFAAIRDETDGRVKGAVFMGQGEPLANYDQVMRAAAVLSHPCGGRIDARMISISTVGLVPQIRRFAAEGRPHRLIVSLTSAIPDKRRTLLPIAGRYPLAELVTALEAYQEACNNRVTVAWVLLRGVNTGPDEVAALRALFGHLRLRINLIDLNETARAPGVYARAAETERQAFLDALTKLGFPVVRRYSGGQTKHAACGMLASTFQERSRRDRAAAKSI
ncbi:MAG: radical SAM protein [Deltaproteobacteria bacterium]|nr:radical SAM protein [Deltaproteobacteria bacterium]